MAKKFDRKLVLASGEEFYGFGFGDRHEMPCLILQNTRWNRGNPVVFKVRHGMREDLLKGITEVGLTVERK